MYVNVLAFPSLAEGETRIPTPVYYQEGDEYTRVNFSGDSGREIGLYPGAVAIFLRGFRQDDALHLFKLDGHDYVSRLRWRGRAVGYGPNFVNPVWRTPEELEVYGALAELYAAGLGGPRSIIYREDRARILSPLHPEKGMEYRLVAAH